MRATPAARPMRRSAGESPTTAVRSGAHAEPRAQLQHGIGRRLVRDAVVGAGERPRTRRRSRGTRACASVGSRSSLVATANSPTRGRSRASSAGEVRHGPGERDRDRGRATPPRTAASAQRRPGARLGDEAPRRPPGCGTSAWRRGGRGRGRGRSPRSTPRSAYRPSRSASPVPPPGGSPAASTQPPHIRWNSMSVPSLSKISRSIPSSSRSGVDVAGHRSRTVVARPTRPRRSAPRPDSIGAAASRTSGPSMREADR